MKLAAFIDLASFEDRTWGMEEDPMRPGAATRAADKVARVMDACGADMLYLDSPCGCGLEPGIGKWTTYQFATMLQPDFAAWRREFVSAFRPVFRRWPTMVYTGGFWHGLQEIPGWGRIETVSRVLSLFSEAGARWWGIDTAGEITGPSWEADVLALSESLGLAPVVEGPARRGSEFLLRYGAVQTSEQFRAVLHGDGVPALHPISAHNPTQPRLVLWNGPNIDPDWSNDFAVDGWKFVKWVSQAGLTPAFGPFGGSGILDMRKFLDAAGVPRE